MLSHKYLWNLSQDFNFYADKCNVLTTIQHEKIGSYCKIFKEKDNEDIIYIWLKGTELKWNDLMIDMFFFKKKLDRKMKVHAGFWTAVESIFDNIYRFLESEKFKSVVIFGHSMGGAMAKEVARRLKDKDCNIMYTLTFGSPRTGNKYYAQCFNWFIMTEYLIKNDIIGKLPPKIFNYCHTRHIEYIGHRIADAHHSYGKFLIDK